MKIQLFASALILTTASLFLSMTTASGQQTAETDVLFRAMQDEMARSVASLQLEGVEKPYFIEYAVTENDTFNASAAFGAVVRSNRSRTRMLQTQVRVGSYDFDNSEFLSQSSLFSRSNFPTSLVVEDDYQALRHDIWLATDGAYKAAAEQLERKRAFVKTRVEEEKLPDFSREEPTTMIAPRQQMQLDEAKWEKQLRQWSAVFRQFPDIQESNVSLRVQLAHKYLINSEGAKTRQPSMLVTLEARASTQASDGLRLRHSIPFIVRSLEELPPTEEITRSIRGIAEELTQLRAAPALADPYLGPVLLSGQASAEIFAQLFAPQLSGHRPPLTEQQLASMAAGRGELADRINRPVLPGFMSVYDDPAQTTAHNQILLGTYRVDDQGMKAQRVSLIEQGVLKSLLMSRRPRKNLTNSNGHGRGGGAQISNLFIQANEGKTEDELKQELIKMCKAQSLPFGILIKALDRSGGAGSDMDGQLLMISGMGGMRRGSISAPLLAYKVYADDGREELIRGITIGEFSVRSLRHITAAGKESFVLNRLVSGSGSPFSFSLGNIPTSIIAPSVLLEEMELKKPSGAQQKPALLTHPYFSK
jgi:TldD protein